MTRSTPDPEWGGQGMLKEVLKSAALDDPAPEDMARLRGRLAGVGIGIAATSAVATTAAAGKAAVGLGMAAKITAGIAVAVTVSVGALHFSRDADESVVVSSSGRGRDGSALMEPKPLVSKQEAALQEKVSSPEPRVQPSGVTAAEPPSATKGNSMISKVAHPSHSVETSAKDEALLLHRARSALAENPRETLSLTEQHQARYPAGVLSEERDVLAINALKRMGRDAEACERVARFIAAHPRATQASELREMCRGADTLP